MSRNAALYSYLPGDVRWRDDLNHTSEKKTKWHAIALNFNSELGCHSMLYHHVMTIEMAAAKDTAWRVILTCPTSTFRLELCDPGERGNDLRRS